MRRMRVAVIGPQNTGKTTLVKDLSAALPEYATPSETYRTLVAREGLTINQQTGEESQRAIREFLFAQTRDFTGPRVIFDRCVVDNHVYTLAAYEAGSVAEPFVLETCEMMRESFSHLDAIAFVPTAVGVPLTDDGLRDTDRGFIDRINRIYLEVLFRDVSSRLPIWILSGSREERVAAFLRRLREAAG